MFGDYFTQLIEKQDLKLDDLAQKTGLSQGQLSMIKNNHRNPTPKTLKKLAPYLGVPYDNLMAAAGHFVQNKRVDLIDALQGDNIQLIAAGQPLTPEQRLGVARVLDNPSIVDKSSTQIPILGTIKAGIPILSEDNYDGELEIPADMNGDFAVEVRGDSMVGAGINPGDYIICKQPQTAYNKDIVAAVRHGEVTLKYFIQNNDRPVLRAANPDYEDIPIDEYTRIEGIKVALIRKESTPYQRYQQYISTRDNNLQEWDEVIEKAAAYGIRPDKVKMILDMHWEMMSRK